MTYVSEILFLRVSTQLHGICTLFLAFEGWEGGSENKHEGPHGAQHELNCVCAMGMDWSELG